MVSLADAILVLFPAARPLVDFDVIDRGDGQGAQVAFWSAALGPPPTAAQLAAVTAQQVQAARQQRSQAAALALLGDPGGTGTALRAVYLAAGLTAQQVQGQLATAAALPVRG